MKTQNLLCNLFGYYYFTFILHIHKYAHALFSDVLSFKNLMSYTMGVHMGMKII